MFLFFFLGAFGVSQFRATVGAIVIRGWEVFCHQSGSQCILLMAFLCPKL